MFKLYSKLNSLNLLFLIRYASESGRMLLIISLILQFIVFHTITSYYKSNDIISTIIFDIFALLLMGSFTYFNLIFVKKLLLKDKLHNLNLLIH